MLAILTRNEFGSFEDFGDSGVNTDHKVLLIFNLFIALINPFMHPLLKRITKDGVANIDNPLLWEFLDFSLMWQMLSKIDV